MTILRLDDFEDDTIVLHFGGGEGSIDAYTLAEALIGFADMARAISATVDPGTDIEILVEATGPGSYRTRIRRIKKDYGGLLTIGGVVFWGIVTNYIYDNYVKNDPPPQITVNADGTVIKTGKYTIIVSAAVHAGTEHAKQNPAVQSGLAKTFAALEADENIKDFGITGSINDPEPKFSIPRADFPKVAQRAISTEEEPTTRTVKKRGRLFVLKAWLNHAKRKWSFEWASPYPRQLATLRFWIRWTAAKCCLVRAMPWRPNSLLNRPMTRRSVFGSMIRNHTSSHGS